MTKPGWKDSNGRARKNQGVAFLKDEENDCCCTCFKIATVCSVNPCDEEEQFPIALPCDSPCEGGPGEVRDATYIKHGDICYIVNEGTFSRGEINDEEVFVLEEPTQVVCMQNCTDLCPNPLDYIAGIACDGEPSSDGTVPVIDRCEHPIGNCIVIQYDCKCWYFSPSTSIPVNEEDRVYINPDEVDTHGTCCDCGSILENFGCRPSGQPPCIKSVIIDPCDQSVIDPDCCCGSSCEVASMTGSSTRRTVSATASGGWTDTIITSTMDHDSYTIDRTILEFDIDGNLIDEQNDTETVDFVVEFGGCGCEALPCFPQDDLSCIPIAIAGNDPVFSTDDLCDFSFSNEFQEHSLNTNLSISCNGTTFSASASGFWDFGVDFITGTHYFVEWSSSWSYTTSVVRTEECRDKCLPEEGGSGGGL